MKVVVLSDTHGNAEIIEQVYEQEQGANAFFHCGDSELSYDDPHFHEMYRVKGNCDFDSDYVDELVVSIGERRIFMTHGHLYNIKMTLTPLDYKAQEVEADIVLFGHSHVLGAQQVGRTLFLNPGSLLLPRGGNPKSYATIEWKEDQDEFTVTFKTPDQQIISQHYFSIPRK
ncbi:metallophosphoesterase [Kurthia gibsonii]|uniref:metallophosphoesterase n=1 Tax=Kurthia gibsonii TaxID=33946 RepID=UPI000B3EE92D